MLFIPLETENLKQANNIQRTIERQNFSQYINAMCSVQVYSCFELKVLSFVATNSNFMYEFRREFNRVKLCNN